MIRDPTSRVAIVYISHHLEEALEITDRAVVLRDGVMTAYARRDEIDLDWIVRNMVGKALTSARRRRVTTLVIPRCR